MEAGLLGQISGTLTLTAVFHAYRIEYSSSSRFQARVRLRWVPLAGDERDRISRRALKSPREVANGSLCRGRFSRTLTDNFDSLEEETARSLMPIHALI